MQAAQKLFDAFARSIWRVDDKRLRQKLWAALNKDAVARAWLFELVAWHRRGRSAADALKLMNGPMRPHAVIEFLERAVACGALQRPDANKIEEGILDHTAASGDWC